MSRTSLRIAGAVALSVAVLSIGCSKSAAPNGAAKPATVSQTSTDQNKAAEKVQNESAERAKDEATIAATLANLSPEDRALAEKQKICPVSGEQLGLMGAPVKLDVKGQPVFICCDGCREKLLASPDDYLAKLNK